VQLVAYPVPGDEGTEAVELVSRHGVSRIQATGHADERRYRFDRVRGDALGEWADADLVAFIRRGWHAAPAWLDATVDSPFPDIVVQMAEMFTSWRAGDLVVFAAPSWDFGGANRGGHGGVTPGEMFVPLIIVGPDVPRGQTIPVARAVDIAPTILHLIHHRPGPDSPPFDGVDRADEVRHAGAPATRRQP
jgi:arylsulfatase A-like enzyme